jgi:hypothetical protein
VPVAAARSFFSVKTGRLSDGLPLTDEPGAFRQRGVSDHLWSRATRHPPSKMVVAHATVLTLTASPTLANRRGRRRAPPDSGGQQVVALLRVVASRSS